MYRLRTSLTKIPDDPTMIRVRIRHAKSGMDFVREISAMHVYERRGDYVLVHWAAISALAQEKAEVPANRRSMIRSVKSAMKRARFND